MRDGAASRAGNPRKSEGQGEGERRRNGAGERRGRGERGVARQERADLEARGSMIRLT